jgi:hypothetical protein
MNLSTMARFLNLEGNLVSQDQNTEAAVVAKAVTPNRIEKMLDDPFASALAATAATALAVTVVLSGIWVISLSVY